MDRVGGAGAGGANQPDIAASSVLDGEGKPMGNPMLMVEIAIFWAQYRETFRPIICHRRKAEIRSQVKL